MFALGFRSKAWELAENKLSKKVLHRFGYHTCAVFTYNLGPIMLKWRAGEGPAIFVVGPSGRSL